MQQEHTLITKEKANKAFPRRFLSISLKFKNCFSSTDSLRNI